MKGPLTLILFVILFSVNSLKAQNPFEKFGYHVKVLTMTSGKYNEFFDQDTIQQVGDVLINTNTMKVIGFAEKDTVNPMPEAHLISRWISPDPLAEERYWISPYNFVQNNPINRIDPDGMLDDGYTIDKDGTIERVDNTGGDKYDVLYAKEDYEKAKNSGKKNEYGNPEPEKQAKINDTGILKELSHWKKDPQGYAVYYAVTESRSDVFKVFQFAADNSNVEWALNGHITEGTKKYFIGSYHLDNLSPSSESAGSGFNERTQFFGIHVHPDIDGTKGASGDWRNKGYVTGDFKIIRDQEKRFNKLGIKLYPHYLYHKHSKMLYYYTPTNSSIPIRKINKASDFFFGAY